MNFYEAKQEAFRGVTDLAGVEAAIARLHSMDIEPLETEYRMDAPEELAPEFPRWSVTWNGGNVGYVDEWYD